MALDPAIPLVELNGLPQTPGADRPIRIPQLADPAATQDVVLLVAPDGTLKRGAAPA